MPTIGITELQAFEQTHDRTRSEDAQSAQAMQCMEIWGGNRAANNAISTPGIDAWVLSRPHAGSAVGGDIHYVSMCMSGSIARFCIADVAGHGAGVSDLALKLRALMRRYINTPDQSRFTRTLNEGFLAQSSESRFATALLATYFAPTDHLVICNAGHPRPIWYRADRFEWSILHHELPDRAGRVRNLPLGVIEPTDYHQFAVELGKGDLVLAYTDSLTEAQDAAGHQLGEKGLLRIVRSLDPTRPDLINDTLVQRIAERCGHDAFDDDLTLMLLHHNAADPPFPTPSEFVRGFGRAIGLLRV